MAKESLSRYAPRAWGMRPNTSHYESLVLYHLSSESAYYTIFRNSAVTCLAEILAPRAPPPLQPSHRTFSHQPVRKPFNSSLRISLIDLLRQQTLYRDSKASVRRRLRESQLRASLFYVRLILPLSFSFAHLYYHYSLLMC